MSDNILKDIEEFLELENYTDYEFKEVCGLTFAFKREIVTIKGRISSASIAPVGIIYEENSQRRKLKNVPRIRKETKKGW